MEDQTNHNCPTQPNLKFPTAKQAMDLQLS